MTRGRDTSDAIASEAARWWAERDAGLLDAKGEAALTAWLAADPRHAKAFAAADALWEDLALTAPGTLAETVSATPQLAPQSSRQRALWAMGACGALTVAAVLGDIPIRLRADAIAATGEVRKVALADGSLAELNTNSAIAIDYDAVARRIRLLRGEAKFVVTADPHRPFTVEAEGGSTTALGTAFVVRREDGAASVAVTEHSVRIKPPGSEASVVVREGQATRYDAEGVATPHAVDARAADAWTRGLIIFEERPLVEVVAELGRYHPGIIRLVGNELGARKVSGVFQVTKPLEAIDTLCASLGLKSVRLTDRLVIIYA